MSEPITLVTEVVKITGGERPSILFENRFKTAAVTYDGKRKEFTRTVTQQVTVSAELYARLVKDVKIGDRIEATISEEENVSKLDGYRVIGLAKNLV